MEVHENVIEFLRDQKTATVSFTQGRYISKVKRLAKSHPDECKIIAENKDGSIMAHVPVKWIRMTPPSKPNLTEEQRQEMSERIHRNILDKDKPSNQND